MRFNGMWENMQLETCVSIHKEQLLGADVFRTSCGPKEGHYERRKQSYISDGNISRNFIRRREKIIFL
jgi:hypothetical protein